MKWRFPPIVPLYTTPGARGRWKHDRGLPGFHAVPFTIEPVTREDGSVIWSEPARPAARATVLSTAFLGVFGAMSVLAAIVLAKSPTDRVMLAFGGLFFLALVIFLAWRGRQDVLGARELILRHERVVVRRPSAPPADCVVARVPVAETVVRVHPFHMDLGNFSWYGVALVIEAGPERMALAISKQAEEIEAYFLSLPKVLQVRRTEDGPILRGRGDVRLDARPGKA